MASSNYYTKIRNKINDWKIYIKVSKTVSKYTVSKYILVHKKVMNPRLLVKPYKYMIKVFPKTAFYGDRDEMTAIRGLQTEHFIKFKVGKDSCGETVLRCGYRLNDEIPCEEKTNKLANYKILLNGLATTRSFMQDRIEKVSKLAKAKRDKQRQQGKEQSTDKRAKDKMLADGTDLGSMIRKALSTTTK